MPRNCCQFFLVGDTMPVLLFRLLAFMFSGWQNGGNHFSNIILPNESIECIRNPTKEINEYAALIGIEAGKEPHLLYLAKEGLMAALPTEWKICYSEEKSGHYYHNTRTKQSQWDHPLDAVYRDLVEQTRQKVAAGGGSAATPIIDNSDDVSQLDSGIRSMQGTDELLDDMSSPLNNGSSQGQGQGQGSGQGVAMANQSVTMATATFPGPSGFSGGVSRFLESRSKSFGPIFQPVKNTRFEVAKTNAQISLSMKFATPKQQQQQQQASGESQSQSSNDHQQLQRKGGAFQLSGTGAMFLKSRRQLEQTPTDTSGSNALAQGGVKGILRDSSLTDMRRRLERDEQQPLQAEGEDKKSVRFNLEETQRLRSSPEDDSSRKLTQSPELSINSDDDEDEDEEEEEEEEEEAAEREDDVDDDEDDDDVWDEVDVVDPDAMEVMCSLNPFISDASKPIRVISVPKSQTIQMMKSQNGDFEQSAGGGGGGGGAAGPAAAVASSYLDKLKETNAVKPLYEDTDSDSKGSSVRSFIINKSDQDSLQATGNNPFDLDELGRKHSHELEQLQRKSAQAASDKLGMRSLKMASKLVGLLKHKDPSGSSGGGSDLTEAQLQQDMEALKREHEAKLKSLRHEYDLRLTSHQHQLEEAFDLQLEEYREQLEQQLQTKRGQVVSEHKARMATLQSNHAEILQELERDLHSEEEILRREHAAKLSQMRDKLAHELELEKQRLRENGEERLYEKVRCEKRLLEDKYRCLKEKYVRLKTDVKLSLERRNRRREAQALQQHHTHTNNTNTTTGSETERSISNKPSIGNSENRSLSYSEQACGGTVAKVKPPVPPKTHLSHKPSITSKYIKHLQLQDDTNTSISQSDTTISNNYSKGRYLPTPGREATGAGGAGGGCIAVLSDNGNSDSEAARNQENNNNSNATKGLGLGLGLGLSGGPRKKLFSRTKSASTSRLNSDNNYKLERPCTPVENLRHQLQKLEDLEDQFPEHTLDTTYHLRYPFTDISNEHAAVVGVGSELEFFKHRIHLERDSVRRAKESLRTQRTNFRARQREIKQRHKSTTLSPRHSLDQLIQEEKELTEMEVNLHRTRALLGEKVIRLRHLEQSLLRIYEKEKPSFELEPKDDATTLSDLSSHSSSGFSSTDFASGADLNKRKEYFQQESNECIQNLEILNAEIREILDILGQKQQSQHQAQMQPLALISPNELSWSHMLSQQSASSTGGGGGVVGLGVGGGAMSPNPLPLQSSSSSHSMGSVTGTMQVQVHAPQSIPTLADRLETYRQLAAGRMHSSMGGAILAANTIVSQSPRAVNYTTSLVERTRDLRNWLRQAKTEHELLTGMGMHGHATPITGTGASNAAAPPAGGNLTTTQPGAAQTNL
ncbi:centrosomal protein of 164 kDa isoform X2 [Drosophila willistoni]|uniref:centrosomal protein of 164 kDa isoform X2 n=1 Tax=Drosophila willistoni TaxID=7260 RepID=UPI001F0849A1|nr:centrosomal protein of 164 kDa isoform X2 [Drosophila willistoni]